LYEEGGIYLDTDMIPIKSMKPYLEHSIVIGFEYRKLVSTGFVAAVPNHPLFSKILDAYESFDNDPEKPFKFLINNEL
jgi:mannosyltransferase OCH1-like enzyme